MRAGVTVSRASATASVSSRPPLSQRPVQAALRQRQLVLRPTKAPLSSTSAVVGAAARRRRSSSANSLVVRAAASFDSLSNSLSKAWDSIRIDGKLTAENIQGPMREIRRALLEADVSSDFFEFFFGSRRLVSAGQIAPFLTFQARRMSGDTSKLSYI